MIRNIDAKFKKPYNNCNLRKIIYHQYLPMFMSIFNLRGAQIDRFRYEVFQNLFLSPMNTGFPRDTVATVLTVYGIETWYYVRWLTHDVLSCNSTYRLRYWNLILRTMINTRCAKLQQYLPFTVLKHSSMFRPKKFIFCCNSTYRLRYWNSRIISSTNINDLLVATVLTVYGIETIKIDIQSVSIYLVATVLTVYGIETYTSKKPLAGNLVATVPTVYGIETEP